MICIWTKLECNDHHDCTTTYTDKMQIDSRDQCEKIGYLHYKLLLQFSFTPKTFVMTMRHRVGEIGKNFDSRPVILDLVLSPSWWCHAREMCWELGFLKWRWPFSAWNHNKQVTSTITNSWHEKAYIDDRRWRQKISNCGFQTLFYERYFFSIPHILLLSLISIFSFYGFLLAHILTNTLKKKKGLSHNERQVARLRIFSVFALNFFTSSEGLLPTKLFRNLWDTFVYVGMLKPKLR